MRIVRRSANYSSVLHSDCILSQVLGEKVRFRRWRYRQNQEFLRYIDYSDAAFFEELKMVLINAFDGTTFAIAMVLGGNRPPKI